jgi:hypothetical protein
VECQASRAADVCNGKRLKEEAFIAALLVSVPYTTPTRVKRLTLASLAVKHLAQLNTGYVVRNAVHQAVSRQAFGSVHCHASMVADAVAID